MIDTTVSRHLNAARRPKIVPHPAPTLLESLEHRRLLSHGVAAPNAPVNLSAVADPAAATIRLSWTDNSSKETGYVVQRKKGRSGAWTAIGTLAANATYFRSAHLATGSTYAYRVEAINRGGASSWSAIASATTVTPVTPAPPSHAPTPSPTPSPTPQPTGHTLYARSQVPASEPLDANGGSAPQWINVSADPLLPASGPTASGVRQGADGDCYFLADLAGIARDDPSYVTKLVSQESNGTYDVTLSRNGVQSVIHVDGYVPATDASDLANANFGADGSVWAAVIEKAYAYFRNPTNPASYAAIAGGDAMSAFSFLGFANVTEYQDPFNGNPTPKIHNPDELFAACQTNLNAGKTVIYSTVGANAATGALVTAHCYTVIAATKDAAGNELITVRNPWGVTGPNNDGVQTYDAATLYHQFDRIDAVTT